MLLGGYQQKMDRNDEVDSYRSHIHRNKRKNGGFQRLEGGENRNHCLMGIEFQFIKMKKFWRLVCKDVKILNTMELYSQRWLRLLSLKPPSLNHANISKFSSIFYLHLITAKRREVIIHTLSESDMSETPGKVTLSQNSRPAVD